MIGLTCKFPPSTLGFIMPLIASTASLLAVIRHHQHPVKPLQIHECEKQVRVRVRTRDGRDVYGCPCMSFPGQGSGEPPGLPAGLRRAGCGPSCP